MFQTPSRACVFMTQQTEFVHSASTGCTDFGGPPPGSAVSLQGLWICRPDCSGFWVCPLQRTRLLLLTRAQTELERQEPDHTPVSAVWGRQAAWAQDTAPAMLCCSAGWGAAHAHTAAYTHQTCIPHFSMTLYQWNTHPYLRVVPLFVCRPCSLRQQSSERVSVLQEIIFCLMRTWLPSTGVCWDQNTHLLLSRYSMFRSPTFLCKP